MARINILAPLDGKVIDLADVPDEVFAQKMAGDGMAIEPLGGVAVAPLNGTLAVLFPGGHAFGLVDDNGIELIVHIGLDTVELKGDGFECVATQGQQVQAGTPIVRFDRARLAQLGKNIVSPVVSNGEGTIVYRASGTVRAGQDILFTLEL